MVQAWCDLLEYEVEAVVKKRMICPGHRREAVPRRTTPPDTRNRMRTRSRRRQEIMPPR
jgi:hypothetical protein